MAEGDQDQDAPQGEERLTRPEAEEQQRAGDQLHEGHHRAGGPRRPPGQEGGSVGLDEEPASMLHRPEHEHLPLSGHEEDQPQDPPGDEDRPASVPPLGDPHRSFSSRSTSSRRPRYCQRRSESGTYPLVNSTSWTSRSRKRSPCFSRASAISRRI